MKANELMIGDWVEVPFLEDKPKIVKVEEILYDEINPEWDGMENYGGIKIKDVKPIPLTPEILEKNGWTYNDENAKFHPNTWSGKGIMLKQESECFRIVVVSDYDDEDTNDTPFVLQYINDLQHALKLRGKDKEIEL